MFGIAIGDALKGWLVKGALALVCVGALYATVKVFQVKNEKIEIQQQTITAKDQVIEAKDDTIKQKDDTIKQVREETVKAASSADATEAVKADVKQAEAKPTVAKTAANQYVESKLAAINKKYDALPQDAANEQRKATEISLERAKGLWLTYCLQEPTNAACK
jgi:predicted phage tail protein